MKPEVSDIVLSMEAELVRQSIALFSLQSNGNDQQTSDVSKMVTAEEPGVLLFCEPLNT